jgi:predicted solute-binding protein
LPQAELESYLRNNIDFHLGEDNRRGLEKYFQEADKLLLIPENKKIEWANAAKDEVRAPAKL